jgi:hypothetical protein
MKSIKSLPVEEETRDRARVTRSKLGVTWDEFVDIAAKTLDPDTEE